MKESSKLFSTRTNEPLIESLIVVGKEFLYSVVDGICQIQLILFFVLLTTLLFLVLYLVTWNQCEMTIILDHMFG